MMVAAEQRWSLADAGVLADRVVDGKGELRIYRLGARSFGTIGFGYLQRAHADALLRYADKLLAARQVAAFHDWFQVTGYEAAGLTLGATLVNAAFRGRITIHSSPDTFRAAWESQR